MLFAAQCEKLFSKYSVLQPELLQNFSSTKDTKRTSRQNMKRGRGEPARSDRGEARDIAKARIEKARIGREERYRIKLTENLRRRRGGRR